MKVKGRILLFVTMLLLLPSIVNAEEKTLTGTWKELESGVTTVKIEEKGSFINQLEEKIKALTLAPHEEGTVFDYSYKVEKEYVEETKNYSTVNLDTLFSTKEEAESYYNDLKVEGKMNPQISTIYNDEGEDIVCETDCANEIKTDYVCRVTPLDYKEIEKTFTSIDALNNYVPENIPGYTYISKSEYTTIYAPRTVTIDENFDTESEANTALSNFISLYGGSGLVTKFRDTTKDVSSTITGTTPYNSEAAANTAKDALQATLNLETFDGTKTAVVRKDTTSAATQFNIENVVTQKFNTSTDAVNYLNFLTGLGYTIDSYTVNTITTLTGNVTFERKLDKSNIFTIDDTNNFILLKQGGGPGNQQVAVWTPTPLTDTQKANFRTTYKQYNRAFHIDGSTDDDLVIEFISGYGSIDLSYLNHNPGETWGTYTFTYDSVNKKIVMTCDRDQISHIVYGVMCSETKYTLSGKMTKPIWYVDVNVLTFGYSYNVKASGTIYDPNYKIIVTYKNNTNKMNCLIPSYKLSYDIETISKISYQEISWFVGSQFLGAGDTTPPETGITVEPDYLRNFMICLLGLATLVKSKKYIFNKKSTN